MKTVLSLLLVMVVLATMVIYQKTATHQKQSRPVFSPVDVPKSSFTNSLGMQFVPVPGTDVLFCIHETRRRDFVAYSDADPPTDTEWKFKAFKGVPSGANDLDPVVGVTWFDAHAFCEWLSKKEGRVYRLPTDREWSIAVGIGGKEEWVSGATPESLNSKIKNEFPWGSTYPPPPMVENYADTTWGQRFRDYPFIPGYTDGFVTTAPVMSFKPNNLGLYDMGGNVWEWVEDWYDSAKTWRAVRGASYYYQGRPYLISSARIRMPPSGKAPDGGFRCVLQK